MERLDNICSGTSIHERKHVRGRTAHVRDCTYIWSQDMPNVLFLVLIYANIPFKKSLYDWYNFGQNVTRVPLERPTEFFY